MAFLNFIAQPLGQFLNFLYNNVAFKNYGLAIIIFTILIRIVILPLTIKQYRSSARMQELGPQMQELQKRYKNDKAKLNEEMMKFYKENKVNPAGGCLPLLIQMPILLSLWQVIRSPLTYMLGWNSKTIASHYALLKASEKISNYKELSIVLKEKLLNMHFLGLNLGMVPKLGTKYLISDPHRLTYWALLILPVLATITTYISSKLMMSVSAANTQSSNNQMAGMQKTMMYIAPVMTLFISFQVPAGLGLYWTTGYIIQIIQQVYINKTIFKKKEVAIK